jgi:hypothetical protein
MKQILTTNLPWELYLAVFLAALPKSNILLALESKSAAFAGIFP